MGINPSLWTAAVGAHFARPGNRFWPALHRAGITEWLVDPSAGMSEADREHVLARGVGITNVVSRATARADELSLDELRAGGIDLERRVTELGPDVVAFAGNTAYRTAFDDRGAKAGRQERTLGGAALWIVPNPSGLNAHETLDSLAAAYAEPAREAGIIG